MTVSSIPHGVPFLPTLAGWILDQWGQGPETLARVTVLLPTRRAVTTLQDILLQETTRRSGHRALLAPRLLAVTGGEQLDTPKFSRLEQELHLAHLILAHQPLTDDRPMSFATALGLAQDMVPLFEQCARENVDIRSLAGIMPLTQSAHFDIMRDLLLGVAAGWQEMATTTRRLDPVRAELCGLELLQQEWIDNPPTAPVVAAGVMGIFPYLHRLQETVLGLPQGHVVLAGLDHGLPETVWRTLPLHHPQYANKCLLDALATAREDVRPLAPPPADGQGELARLLMLPAAQTGAWFTPATVQIPENTVFSFEAESLNEESFTIALILRHCTETPGRTAALVTNDQTLAAQVHAQLARWGIIPNDSTGRRLADIPAGTFMQLVADLATGRLQPATLMDLLRHPFCLLGRPAFEARQLASALERVLLRGPRPGAYLSGLPQRLAQALEDPRQLERLGGVKAESLTAYLDDLIAALKPLSTALRLAETPMESLCRAHIDVGMVLATDSNGKVVLWQEQEGRDLYRHLQQTLDSHALPTLPGGHYGMVFRTLLQNARTYPTHPHPRVFLWGLQEAQLQTADTVVIGGINEGSMPGSLPDSPWLNRAMQQDMGLSLPEQRTGLEAHWFCQLLQSPRVILSRARRVDGTPQVPSRWWQKLDALLALQGIQLPQPPEFLLARQLLRPQTLPAPLPALPCPPGFARPQVYSASSLQLLRENPYAFYAKYILHLSPLDVIDKEHDARDRGNIMHGVLERFCRDWPVELPERMHGILCELSATALAGLGNPVLQLFWQSRLQRLCLWFTETEQALRPGRLPLALETAGEWSFTAMNQGFTLKAKADRIDRDQNDRSLIMIDYKGTAPGNKQVCEGQTLQMLVEGVMAKNGAFPDLDTAKVTGLEYWSLTGSCKPPHGNQVRIDPETLKSPPEGIPATLPELLATAETFIRLLLTTFADDRQPYPVWPLPWLQDKRRTDDYAHLARVAA